MQKDPKSVLTFVYLICCPKWVSRLPHASVAGMQPLHPCGFKLPSGGLLNGKTCNCTSATFFACELQLQAFSDGSGILFVIVGPGSLKKTSTAATTTTTTTITTTFHYNYKCKCNYTVTTAIQLQLHLLQPLQLQLQLHFNYTTATTTITITALQLQQHLLHYKCKEKYTRTTTTTRTIITLRFAAPLHAAFVGEVTTATTRKITTIFRSINGFALPSMHQKNSLLL